MKYGRRSARIKIRYGRPYRTCTDQRQCESHVDIVELTFAERNLIRYSGTAVARNGVIKEVL